MVRKYTRRVHESSQSKDQTSKEVCSSRPRGVNVSKAVNKNPRGRKLRSEESPKEVQKKKEQTKPRREGSQEEKEKQNQRNKKKGKENIKKRSSPLKEAKTKM
jgi:hypothetical protein